MLSDADDGGRSNTIRDNELSGNEVGVHLTAGTRGAVVRDNVFTSNTTDGIWVELANANRIERNEITLSGGIAINLDAVEQQRRRRQHPRRQPRRRHRRRRGGAAVEQQPHRGQHARQQRRLRDRRHRLDRQPDRRQRRRKAASAKPSSSSSPSTPSIEGNELLGNGDGIGVSETRNSRIEANNAVGGTGSGITLDTASLNNVVRANTASSNLGEGIEVADFAPSGQGNLVERNTANGNGGDGLIVEGSGHTITANVANLNGGFGMFVVPGNADGGGNHATGNVEPQQCEGVVCTIGEAPGAPQTILLEGPPARQSTATRRPSTTRPRTTRRR